MAGAKSKVLQLHPMGLNEVHSFGSLDIDKRDENSELTNLRWIVLLFLI